MRSSFLPFALPDTGETEITEIAAAIRSGWVTTGPKTRQFETEFAAMVGANHAIAVNSCTAAMHLALEAIGLQPGDLVLTSPYTFAATAEVIRYFKATPIFVDVEPDTLNLDPALAAILPVHLAGLPAELDALYTIAAQHHLAVIEDAAHAFPAQYKGRAIGSQSSVTSHQSPEGHASRITHHSSLLKTLNSELRTQDSKLYPPSVSPSTPPKPSLPAKGA